MLPYIHIGGDPLGQIIPSLAFLERKFTCLSYEDWLSVLTFQLSNIG